MPALLQCRAYSAVSGVVLASIVVGGVRGRWERRARCCLPLWLHSLSHRSGSGSGSGSAAPVLLMEDPLESGKELVRGVASLHSCPLMASLTRLAVIDVVMVERCGVSTRTTTRSCRSLLTSVWNVPLSPYPHPYGLHVPGFDQSVSLVVEIQRSDGSSSNRPVTTTIPASVSEATKVDVSYRYLAHLVNQIRDAFGIVTAGRVTLFFLADGSRLVPLTS